MKVPVEMAYITKVLFHSVSGLALRFLYVPGKGKEKNNININNIEATLTPPQGTYIMNGTP